MSFYAEKLAEALKKFPRSYQDYVVKAKKRIVPYVGEVDPKPKATPFNYKKP